jgi:hypothetical protein
VSLLVQAGANADARDAFGVSARELAEQQGGALPRLLRRGARR